MLVAGAGFEPAYTFQGPSGYEPAELPTALSRNVGGSKRTRTSEAEAPDLQSGVIAAIRYSQIKTLLFRVGGSTSPLSKPLCHHFLYE